MASDENVREVGEGESLLGLSSLPISPHLLQRIVQKGLCVKCVEHDQGCTWEGSLIHMQDHVDNECRYFSIDCPNQCGTTALDAKGLDDHLENECPEQVVCCKYADKTGCQYKDKRKNMPSHEKDAEKHLALLESAMMNLKKENKKLRQENKILKKTSVAGESQNEPLEIIDTGNAVSLLGLKQTNVATSNGHQASFSSNELEEAEQNQPQYETYTESTASEEEENLPSATPAKKKRKFSSERSEICKRMSDFDINPCPREFCKMKKMIKSSPVLLCKECNRWCHAHCANIHAVQAPKLKCFTCPACRNP